MGSVLDSARQERHLSISSGDARRGQICGSGDKAARLKVWSYQVKAMCELTEESKRFTGQQGRGGGQGQTEGGMILQVLLSKDLGET
jgi:hypothetical protein